jgi:hypothetical protein
MKFGLQAHLTRCHPERSEGSWLLRPLTPTLLPVHSYAVIFRSRPSGANGPTPTPFPAVLTSPSQIAEITEALSPAFGALGSRVSHKSFACHPYKKHTAWGTPSFSVNSVNSALKPTQACFPNDPFYLVRPVPISPLESTLAGHPANAHSKRLTRFVSPLYPTFTNNPRGLSRPSLFLPDVYSEVYRREESFQDP